jgi:hypothetical protein
MFQQAFVHFSPHRKSDKVFEEIEKKGSFRFYPYQYRPNLNTRFTEKKQNEYWVLLKNKNPVPKTELNIDQIAHNQKLMEERSAQMEERSAQMEERETQMTQKMAQMEQKMAQMEERNARMEEQFNALIKLNENVCKVVDVQTTNIQMLSNISEKVEETVNSLSDDKCRICNDTYVFSNDAICSNCWETCEPAIPLTREGLQIIEKKITSLKKNMNENYWQLNDNIEEQRCGIKTLFERTWLDIEKLLEKTEKNSESIEKLSYDTMYYSTKCFRQNDEKIDRIIGVVQDLVEQVSDKAMADLKTEFMHFGFTYNNLCKMTIDELV